MKRLFWVFAAVLLFVLPIIKAENTDESSDPAFVSLTREATPMSKLPTNISVFTAQQIKDSGANSVAEVLSLLPGIDVQRGGELGSLASVRIRGVPDSNQVQILVDDQPLGGVSIQSVNIGIIPVDNIERIEVVRGSSPGLYGANTIGGVIHIITKKKTTEAEAKFGFEGRSYKTKINAAQVSGKASLLDYFVTANHYETEGYQVNGDVNDTNVTTNIGSSFDNGARVDLALDFTQHELGTPNGTPVAFDQWNGETERAQVNTPTQRVEDNLHKARLKGRMPLGSGAQVETNFFNLDESYALRSAPDTTPFAEFHNTILGNDTRVAFVNGLILGGAYEWDGRDSQGQASHNISNWGGYAQDEFHLSKLSVMPALRYDQQSTFGHQWNPRLALVYQAQENWKISANAARAYRAPTLVNLYIDARDPLFPAFDFVGNPNLQPETAWTYDLGTEVRAHGMKFGVSGYYTKIKDRIATVDTDGNGNDDTYQNASRAELAGAEVDVSAQTGFITHELNGTFQRAKGNSTTSTEYVNLRLTPKFIGNYRLIARLPAGARFINTLQYSGKQFQNDNDGGKELPSYTLWNIRLEEKIKALTMFAGVNNITDKLYAESFTFGTPVPQATRNYVAGATLAFR